MYRDDIRYLCVVLTFKSEAHQILSRIVSSNFRLQSNIRHDCETHSKTIKTFCILLIENTIKGCLMKVCGANKAYISRSLRVSPPSPSPSFLRNVDRLLLATDGWESVGRRVFEADSTLAKLKLGKNYETKRVSD